MTHLKITTVPRALCFIIFILLAKTSCCSASRQVQEPAPSFYNHGGCQTWPLKLPRRLKMTEEVAAHVKGQATEDNKFHNNDKANNLDYQVDRKIEAKEGSDNSPLFTMDYTPVRRRRPIHNKSLPVGP